MHQPLIFDIKRYCINDGPGIRMTIFFKGCPLSCAWCHNPESISPKQQKLFTASKCIGCGECVNVCPRGAITLAAEGIVTDPVECNLCGDCAAACPTRAIEMAGRIYTIDELMDMVEKERIFFEQSDGGVTISGGEPLLHPEFLFGILKALGEKGIHRAVDTSGFCDPQTLLDIAQQTDLFLYDLKLIDDELHRKFTGVSNVRLLENLRGLAESGAKISIRVPVIGGVNADEENMRELAEFVAALPGEKRPVHLLAYHGVAAHKYLKLGGAYTEGGMCEPGEETLEKSRLLFAELGVEAVIGG